MNENFKKVMKQKLALFLALIVAVSGLMVTPLAGKAQEVSSSNPKFYTANGVFDSAVAVELGVPTQGSFTKETYNSATYKLTLPSTGKLSIDLTSYIDSVTSFSVYDANGLLMKSELNMSWDSNIKQLYKSYDLYLTKGVYYILISGHTTTSDSYGNFKFTPTFTTSNVNGSDTNNDFSVSMDMKLSTVYTGQISMNDRNDYYKLTVKEDGYYLINQVTSVNSSYSILHTEDGTELFYDNATLNKKTKKGEASSIRYLKAGTYIIQVYSSKEYGESTYTLKVTSCVSKIKLNKKSFSLKKGKKFKLKATVTPTSAESKKLIWTSSKKAVATVSSSGKITAKKKGTTYITCKAADKKGVSTKIKVTVK